MTRRLAVALLAVSALAACHRDGPPQADLAAAAARGTIIPCALSGSKVFQKDCSVERLLSGDGMVLVLHHHDGGFRRLLVTTDGRGVVTADGADQAEVKVIDPGTIDVTVGDDRYRLPATVKGQAIPKR